MQSIKKFIGARPHLSMTFLFGFVAYLLLPNDFNVVTRALLGWNVAVWSYLALVVWLMSGASHESVRKIAQDENEGAFAVLVILSVCCAASLLAIIYELANMQGLTANGRLLKYLFTALTVLGSWCLLGIIFTIHYAFLFFASPKGQRALQFPESEEAPNYWDFLYFSFTINVALQTSDIIIKSRKIRKTVLAHSILSFFFNAAILGFSINIAASLVGGGT